MVNNMKIKVSVPVEGTYRRYSDPHGETEEDWDTETETVYYEPTEQDLLDYYGEIVDEEEYSEDEDFGEWLVDEGRVKL